MMQPVEVKETPEAASHTRQHNFSAGPGTLPEEVLLELRDELPVYGDVGASVMEISHRSPAYDAIRYSNIPEIRGSTSPGPARHSSMCGSPNGRTVRYHAVSILPISGVMPLPR